jgi:hypothetical protein
MGTIVLLTKNSWAKISIQITKLFNLLLNKLNNLIKGLSLHQIIIT